MIWKFLILWTGSESPVRERERARKGEGTAETRRRAPHSFFRPPLASPRSLPPSLSQVVVVLSGSMEPAFYRGDILFLNNGPAPIAAGEVVVFNIDGRDIPIVHRVVKVHDRSEGGGGGPTTADLEQGAAAPFRLQQQDILTKGDNNWGDDRALYAKGQKWLGRQHIMGRVVG